jgi:hypothetical protein
MASISKMCLQQVRTNSVDLATTTVAAAAEQGVSPRSAADGRPQVNAKALMDFIPLAHLAAIQ